MIISHDNFTPLKITFSLRNGAVMRQTTHPIHLDALLAYVAFDRSWQTATDFSAIDNLPLAKLTNDEQTAEPVWAASQLFFTPKLTEIRHWTRRTNPHHIEQYRASGVLHNQRSRKIDTGSGAFKNALNSDVLMHVDTITCFAIGDAQQLTDMLSELKFIGKNHHHAYGEITNVEIVPDETALERVYQRTLSWPHSDDYVPGQFAFAPPYWKNQQLGYHYCVDYCVSQK